MVLSEPPTHVGGDGGKGKATTSAVNEYRAEETPTTSLPTTINNRLMTAIHRQTPTIAASPTASNLRVKRRDASKREGGAVAQQSQQRGELKLPTSLGENTGQPGVRWLKEKEVRREREDYRGWGV